MWNKENTRTTTRRFTKKYGRELFQEGSSAIKRIEEFFDEVVASAMIVDKEMITVARQWRTAIKRIATLEGLVKVKEIMIQENRSEKLEVAERSILSTEVEMKTVVNVEIVESRINADEEIEDIRIINESSEIKPREDVFKKKFEQLEEYIKMRHGNLSLDESIWAPTKDACKEKGEFKAKVAAINVLGDNAEQREKCIRWSLRGTKHLKEIYEKFAKGNLWCILHFDCKKGYEEAKARFENKKEEYEQLNLILEKTPRERTIISNRVKPKAVERTKS